MTRGKPSGSTKGSGGRRPTASPAPVDDVIMTDGDVVAFLKIGDHPERDAIVARIPHAVVGGERRFVRDQVITWAALGGDRQRHASRRQEF